jgi:uncharacterized membrane protein YcaP (DUF421 family)
MDLLAFDWYKTFAPSVSWTELIVRGSLLYLALFVMMRFILKREGGTIGLADLLMTVLIADAAQNGMANEYKSATDGLVLVSTIIFWNYTIDWLTFRFRFVSKLIEPPPLKLVENGRMLRRNMRKEMISPDELMSHVRQSGAGSLAEVREVFMEGDGRISVIRRD